MNEVQLKEVEHLDAALTLIDEAKAALIAIGDMMQPDMNAGDEQLNGVRRSQAAAIFRFFGNALEEPLRSAVAIKDRMDLAALKAI